MSVIHIATWFPKNPATAAAKAAQANLTRHILAVRAAARTGRRLGPRTAAESCFTGSTNSVLRG